MTILVNSQMLHDFNNKKLFIINIKLLYLKKYYVQSVPITT